MGGASTAQTGSVLLLLLNSPANAQLCAAFVDRYGPQIHGWCRRRGRQEADAQDVTQIVLTRLVHKLRTFAYDPAKGSFRAWLRTLTHHAWCDYLQGRQRAGGDGGTPDVRQALEATFDLEVFEEAQARVRLRVTPRDWVIFQDLALQGRPGPQVARELNLSVAAVLMAKSRVQQK